MTNYVKSVDFAAKDALATGNPSKLIRGTELNTEFNNIATAVTTKEDSANKGAANGYAGLDSNARLASTVMPALTGDVTTTAGAVATTIANSAVTNAKLANMAQNTIKGRITASTGAPEDLSAANVIAILNTSSGLATSVITSGTFANALVAQSNVTQHQAALTIATSQITGGFAASVLTSGTLADARVAFSNVSQYQSSLKCRNITGRSGTSFTIQSGGSASGGSDGDIIGIY